VIEKIGIFEFAMARRVPGTHFLRNLVDRRSLLFQLVRRDFEQRFVGSAVGWVWGLIHPLVLLLSWVYVFGFVIGLPTPASAGTQHFPLYVFSGMLPWMLFSETVQRSASSLLDHANLITKTVFPAEFVPASVFLSTLVSHLLALALMVVATLCWEKKIAAGLLLLPFYMFLIGLLAVGTGWIAASLHVFLRDTAQMVSVVLTFWFWMTPIMIAEDKVPHQVRFLLTANPMYYAVRLYRQALFTSKLPDWGDVAKLALFGATVFLAGGLFFRYMKKGFADVL
jgi:lipopolysaccharide transport system permease protein